MKVGYFSDEKREYIIENMHPRRPLKNFLWNSTTFAEIDQFCFGVSKSCINRDFKPLVNGVRLAYIKDEDGEIFDINRNLKDLPYEKHLCHVGIGYQTVESAYKGLESSFTVLVPENENAELYEIKIKNVGDGDRRITLYPYVRPNVNINGHLAYGNACYREDIGALYYTFRAFRATIPYSEVFFASDAKHVAYSTSDVGFLGAYGSLERPSGVLADKLPSDNTVFEDNYCAALQIPLTVKAGEERSFYFAVGTATSEEESKQIVQKLATREGFERELAWQKKLQEEYMDNLTVSTPDEFINSTVNVWLKRQIALGKDWGRIYGKGFRDLLQDITGFVAFDGKRARDRLVYTLEHQFISGNGLRQFDPVVDYPYQDMPVWIPIAVLAYLKETGDFAVLNEKVGYYDDEAVETVFEHVKRGMDFLYENQGERGLNLWRGGDWNDSMNNCGLQDKGESVWLAIATVKATDDYVEILKNSPIEKAEALVSEITEKKERLKANILKYGWDKDHFIYGINDWNEKVGAWENEEGKAYLNPQTWAVMAGILPKAELEKVMDFVEENLGCDYGYMQNVPSYTKPDEHLGRVSFFNAGVYENGSVYNHGVMFKVVADCMLGRADNAYRTLKAVRYDNPKNDDSGVEPYAISNMYFGPNAFARKGFAPCAWVTGSAGWQYRAITEFILGVQADFDGLKIVPCMPGEWGGAEVTRVFRGANYVISYERGEDKGVYVGGIKQNGNKIPLARRGETVSVKVIF